MKKLLSKEIVEQAIADIKAAGDKPTIERIRKITGGSPKTIIAIKRLINDSEHDNTNDSVLSFYDSKNGSKYDNILSLNDIDIRINQQLEQRFEQLKSELLSELKKSNFDSVSTEQMNQTITALETENRELKKKLEQLNILNQKITTENNQLVQKKTKQSETIEQLQADIERLKEALETSLERLKEAEKERDEARSEVAKFASKMRSRNEPSDMIETESNDSKTEPENELIFEPTKLINPTTKERCFELFESGHKQKDIVKICDIEGKKNAAGNKLAGGTVSKWHTEWKNQKASKKASNS